MKHSLSLNCWRRSGCSPRRWCYAMSRPAGPVEIITQEQSRAGTRVVRAVRSGENLLTYQQIESIFDFLKTGDKFLSRGQTGSWGQRNRSSCTRKSAWYVKKTEKGIYLGFSGPSFWQTCLSFCACQPAESSQSSQWAPCPGRSPDHSKHGWIFPAGTEYKPVNSLRVGERCGMYMCAQKLTCRHHGHEWHIHWPLGHHDLKSWCDLVWIHTGLTLVRISYFFLLIMPTIKERLSTIAQYAG